MAVKNSRITLKSLQIEVNKFKEELKSNKTELAEVKEELKNVKNELKHYKDKETGEIPKGKSEEEFGCKICDVSFISKKSLKMHIQSDHRHKIKCESCDQTFKKNCDLESHIERNHDSVEKFKCDKCDKCFVLKWRLKKHQDIHTNPNIRKCHYYNNQKHCPFEIIGCMFDHSLSGKCNHGEKCTKKLCTFQHDVQVVSENEREENVEDIKKDNDVDGINSVDKESSDEDEESFQLYVKTNFSAVFDKFKIEKTIKCYYCDFYPKSRKLRDLEDEMITHVSDTHKEAKEVLEKEIFDDEYHEDFLGLFTDE